jgi:flagellar biosynthesis GTPase FlhF
MQSTLASEQLEFDPPNRMAGNAEGLERIRQWDNLNSKLHSIQESNAETEKGFQRVSAEAQEIREQFQQQEKENREVREKFRQQEEKFRQQEEKFRQQKEKLRQQEEKFRQQEEKHQVLHRREIAIRMTELQEYGGEKPGPAKGVRNQAVHGGALELDLQVVNAAKRDRPPQFYGEICKGFKKCYGISVAEYRQYFATAPDGVIKTFDQRANLEVLHRWNLKQHPYRKTTKIRLQWLCTKVIDSWKESHLKSEPFPTPEVDKWLQELRKAD